MQLLVASGCSGMRKGVALCLQQRLCQKTMKLIDLNRNLTPFAVYELVASAPSVYIYIYIYPDRPVLKSVCFASSFFPLASLFSFPPSLPLHKPTKTDSYSFLCKPTIVSQSLFLNLHPFFKNLTTHLRLYPNTLNIPNSKQTNRLTFNK